MRLQLSAEDQRFRDEMREFFATRVPQDIRDTVIGRREVTRDQIVYVDLGAEDNVRVGDMLTVFRPLGTGNIEPGPPSAVIARDYGYQSEVYRGGKFSNQSSRKKGSEATGRQVSNKGAKEGRPAIRKVVGEAVVLNVKERTATVVITRTAGEIHTGDWVEVQ